MPRELIESVPNISEGRRPEVVERIARAAEGEGCWRIDTSSDPDHNRSVITLVGDAPGLTAGILRLVAQAVERIDLRTHRGAHPRMGAVDVIPFIPVQATRMEDCVALSRKVGAAIAERFAVPVLLYEESASASHRRNLALVRKGEFEGLTEKLAQPRWAPDFGPGAPHPSAGAVAVGAREFLIAFNINLASSDLEVAKRIASAVRHSSGGLRYVKALGIALEERGTVQVSMNLTNYRKTPVLRVVEAVEREARRYGVAVTDSEIVGKIPRGALYGAAAAALRLHRFDPSSVLEERIDDVLRGSFSGDG
jgi:glutamate formiminotransferase